MNKTEKVSVTAGGVPFTKMWMAPTSSGMSFGLSIPGRDVHLTTYLRENNSILNCHITDTAKEKRKVWEQELRLSDMDGIAQELMDNCIERYSWFSKYDQLSTDLHKAFGMTGQSATVPKAIDVKPIIVACVNEDGLTWQRIRKGYYGGHRAGLLYSEDDDFLAFPVTKNEMFVLNLDLSKTPLWKLPPVQGMMRYLEYLEREKIEILPEEKLEQIASEIIGVLAETTPTRLNL